MSKVTRYFCDVCGRELDEEMDFPNLDMFEYFACTSGNTTIEADLCDNCLANLQHDVAKLIIDRVKSRKGNNNQ